MMHSESGKQQSTPTQVPKTSTGTIPATSGTSAPKPAQTPPTGSQAPTYKAYTAPVCTNTVIPHGTDTIYDKYSYLDEVTTIEGRDGYTETCTADSTGWKPTDNHRDPINTKVYQGTKARPAPGQSRQDEIDKCVAYIKQLSPGSNAYMQCY